MGLISRVSSRTYRSDQHVNQKMSTSDPKYVKREIYQLLRGFPEDKLKLLNHHELINDLSKTIANDPGILDVLKELQEIQHLTEQNQANIWQLNADQALDNRTNLINQQKNELKNARGVDKKSVTITQTAALKLLDKENFDKMARIGNEINQKMQERVKQQQVLLQQTGLMEFYETDDVGVISRQMAILDLLVKLKEYRS